MGGNGEAMQNTGNMPAGTSFEWSRFGDTSSTPTFNSPQAYPFSLYGSTPPAGGMMSAPPPSPSPMPWQPNGPPMAQYTSPPATALGTSAALGPTVGQQGGTAGVGAPGQLPYSPMGMFGSNQLQEIVNALRQGGGNA